MKPLPADQERTSLDLRPFARGRLSIAVGALATMKTALGRSAAVCALLCCWAAPVSAQERGSVEERLRNLEERQATQEQELKEKDAQIRELEGQLARAKDPLDQRSVVAVDAGSAKVAVAAPPSSITQELVDRYQDGIVIWQRPPTTPRSLSC